MHARLCESAAKGEVIVSEEVWGALAGQADGEVRAPISVNGIDRELLTYRLASLDATSAKSTVRYWITTQVGVHKAAPDMGTPITF